MSAQQKAVPTEVIKPNLTKEELTELRRTQKLKSDRLYRGATSNINDSIDDQSQAHELRSQNS